MTGCLQSRIRISFPGEFEAVDWGGVAQVLSATRSTTRRVAEINWQSLIHGCGAGVVFNYSSCAVGPKSWSI